MQLSVIFGSQKDKKSKMFSYFISIFSKSEKKLCTRKAQHFFWVQLVFFEFKLFSLELNLCSSTWRTCLKLLPVPCHLTPTPSLIFMDDHQFEWNALSLYQFYREGVLSYISSALPRNSSSIKLLFPINPESHKTVSHGGASLVPVSPLVVETLLTPNLKTPMTIHKYPPLSPLSSLAESLNEVTPDGVSSAPKLWIRSFKRFTLYSC